MSDTDDNKDGNNSNDNKNEKDDCEIKLQTAIKIPPFWAENPELWFAQIESQFSLHRITKDHHKFNQIVGNLDGKILQYVSDAVINPPEANKYENIKKKISECFAESSEKKMTKLLEDLQLGDQRPSQLLNRQKDLAGSKINKDFLKTLWLRQLPSNVRTILTASSDTVELDELAKLADKIIEVSTPNQSSTMSVKSTENENLIERIDKLTKQINQLQRRYRSRSRSRSNSKQDKPTGKRKFEKCWYHFKFGDESTKCVPPCNHPKNK